MPAPWAAHAQVRIIGTLHGQVTNNVLNFATNTVINDDPTGIALLKQLANDVKDCVEATLLPAVTQDWTFVRCEATKMAPTKGDAVESDAPVATVGEQSVTSVSFAATLINLSTGGGGKSGRGKIFLPPPGETKIEQSQFPNDINLLLIQFLLCLAGKFWDNATTPWRMGVLSRKKVNNVLPPIDDRFRILVAATPNPVLAKLGSRKRGNGP